MSSKKSEAEHARARQAPLVKQYRAIGPAAVAAAVLALKKQKPQPLPASLPAKA